MRDLSELRNEIGDIDRQMADLFERRMNISRQIAAYKSEKGLPVKDEKREAELITRNKSYISDDQIRSHYETFFRSVLDASCDYQNELIM